MAIEPFGQQPNRRIALLIDADNVSYSKIGEILAELARYGVANIRRAYGDWTGSGLKGWKDKLHEFAIRPMQQFSYTTGKNATDMALVIDAMELQYTQKLDSFCIVSSDADFTPLVMHLRSNGQDVYGFGQQKTPDPFVNACTAFLYIENLGNGVEADVPQTEVQNDAVVKAKDEPAKPVPVKSKGSVSKAPLACDTKLMNILRGAVSASIREDGWAAMSAAGAAAKRQAPIDPRNYGVKNFTALFEATGLFEVKKTTGGRVFVADRRNSDRSTTPAA